jgi:hypothetical protein
MYRDISKYLSKYAIPRTLTQEHCGSHIRISGELINVAGNSLDLLLMIITDDRNSCFMYDLHINNNPPTIITENHKFCQDIQKM